MFLKLDHEVDFVAVAAAVAAVGAVVVAEVTVLTVVISIKVVVFVCAEQVINEAFVCFVLAVIATIFLFLKLDH